MTLGLTPFTLLHVAISLIGIASGLTVIFAMLRSDRASLWTAGLLAFIALTTSTGFLFPIQVPHTPAFNLGVISSIVLIAVIVLGVLALRRFKPA